MPFVSSKHGLVCPFNRFFDGTPASHPGMAETESCSGLCQQAGGLDAWRPFLLICCLGRWFLDYFQSTQVEGSLTERSVIKQCEQAEWIDGECENKKFDKIRAAGTPRLLTTTDVCGPRC